MGVQSRLLLSTLLNINLAVNDIAIIRVKNSSSSSLECLERAVVPACLPSPGENFSSGLMSGWGRLGDRQAWSRLLRAAPVSIVSPGACNRNVRSQLATSSSLSNDKLMLLLVIMLKADSSKVRVGGVGCI